MPKNIKPNTGLVIIITFVSNTNIGKINIFNLHLGKNIIPQIRVRGLDRDPLYLSMLGTFVAIMHNAEYGSNNKIYFVDRKVNEMVGKKSYHKTMELQHMESKDPFFILETSKFVSFWKPEWGSLKKEVVLIKQKIKLGILDDLPF